MNENIPAKIDAVSQAIDKANTIPELKLIHDQINAMRPLIKQLVKEQRMDFDGLYKCAVNKLDAERKAGGMLVTIERSVGGRPPNNSSLSDEFTYSKILEESTLHREIAKRWQIESEYPNDLYLQLLAELLEQREEPTSRTVFSLALKARNETKKEPTADESIPTGLFNVIAVDPPWPYGGSYSSTGHRVASPYEEMSIEDIMMIEIPSSDNCIMWLWTTNKFMHEAYHILEAWAFEPKSILTWFKQQTGVGHWLRGQTEHCLFAIKGKPVITHSAQGTFISEKAKGHSQKPEAFYQLVESLCPGSKLEMFAKSKREGWESHGNQRTRK